MLHDDQDSVRFDPGQTRQVGSRKFPFAMDPH